MSTIIAYRGLNPLFCNLAPNIQATNGTLIQLADEETMKNTYLPKRNSTSPLKARTIRYFPYVDIDKISKCHSDIRQYGILRGAGYRPINVIIRTNKKTVFHKSNIEP